MTPNHPPTEAPPAGLSRAETGWLIEDVWTQGPGTPLYIHKDFNLRDWTEELARNRVRRGRGLNPLSTVRVYTTNAAEAMSFDTFGAAIRWLAFQPKWLNSEQYQAREHMWPAALPQQTPDDTGRGG